MCSQFEKKKKDGIEDHNHVSDYPGNSFTQYKPWNE